MITQRSDLARVVWRVSTYSGNSGNCVEIADLPNSRRALRDSKNRTGPVLILPLTEWAAFTAGIHSGDFD